MQMLADIFAKPNDVFYLAEGNIEYCGDIPVSQFSRLQAHDGSDAQGVATLSINMSAGRVPREGRYIDLSIQGTVFITCQRCLQPAPCALNIQRLFGLVTDENYAERLLDKYEPLIIEEGNELSITHLIEDEVILEVPLVAYHDDEQCNVYLNTLNVNEVNVVTEAVTTNPFEALKNLK